MAGFRNHAPTRADGSPGPDSGSTPDGHEMDGSKNREDATEGNSASAPVSGLIQVLSRFVEEIIGSADSLIEVYSDRIKLSVRRKIVQAVIGGGLALCGAVGLAVWMGAAALATLRGICGGFAALWGGSVWLGDLSGGVLALGLAVGTAAFFLRLSSRRELRRLRAKYERIRNHHHADPSAPAENAAGIA